MKLEEFYYRVFIRESKEALREVVEVCCGDNKDKEHELISNLRSIYYDLLHFADGLAYDYKHWENPFAEVEPKEMTACEKNVIFEVVDDALTTLLELNSHYMLQARAEFKRELEEKQNEKVS